MVIATFFPGFRHVPIWGKHVVKLECCNHACKCLRSNLEKLVINKPHNKGKGKLTKLVRIRFASAARCAIKIRSEDAKTNKQAAIKQLDHDIRNSIYHKCGNQSRCSNFCNVASTNTNQESMNGKYAVDKEGDTSFYDA
ncbi:hypothetical protein KP79_PYT15062 [Mizuhopecten yessoensis]|uniref:Uncharacterized protein n=1 Tax=Mizuhopecten yessoensis TaxID=6573 RepID=A0A210QVN8_MIZYE|nr:hypothetical protein KP79_PYT15062 [Mizuhopecten yessoensis]